MKRKKIQIVRIAATLIVSQLVIGTSVANAFDDDFIMLQEQQFRLQRQLMDQQLKMQRQQFQLDRQLMEQHSKTQRQLMNQQFKMQSQQFAVQQIGWQRNVDTELLISETLHWNSLTWRSLEAAGLTHWSGHVAMFRRSADVFSAALKPPYTYNTTANLLGEGFRGASLGFRFGGSLLRDWEMMEKGNWSFWQSYTFEEMGAYGMGQLANWAYKQPANWRMSLTAGLGYGLPDAVRGTFSPNLSIDQRWALWLDSLHTGVAGSLWGSAGANLFKSAAIIGRFITYPLFEAPFMRAKGLPVRSAFEIWAQDLKAMGFGSGTKGLQSIQQMTNLLGTQQTRFEQLFSAPINHISDVDNTRIEQTGFIRESHVILTPTNAFDRWLVDTGFLNPNSLFDPKTSTITTTRQGFTTTRETLKSSNSPSIVGQYLCITDPITSSDYNRYFGTSNYDWASQSTYNNNYSALGNYISITNPTTISDYNRYFGTYNTTLNYSYGSNNRIYQPTFNNNFGSYGNNYQIYQPQFNNNYGGSGNSMFYPDTSGRWR